MIKYEDLVKANETINTTNIKGKEYAEVNQRVKAFRMVYPMGTIQTEMISNENGVCIFKASIYNNENLIATGTAYEKENSTFINKTSYIENCETSAVGRALGMAGFGIDTSIVSADEAQNAMNNQEEPTTKYMIDFGKYKGKTIKEIYDNDKEYIDWFFSSPKCDEYARMCVELLDDKYKNVNERMNLIANIKKLMTEKKILPNEVSETFNKTSNEMDVEELQNVIDWLKAK